MESTLRRLKMSSTASNFSLNLPGLRKMSELKKKNFIYRVSERVRGMKNHRRFNQKLARLSSLSFRGRGRKGLDYTYVRPLERRKIPPQAKFRRSWHFRLFFPHFRFSRFSLGKRFFWAAINKLRNCPLRVAEFDGNKNDFAVIKQSQVHFTTRDFPHFKYVGSNKWGKNNIMKILLFSLRFP